jgi:hypothetical protein
MLSLVIWSAIHRTRPAVVMFGGMSMPRWPTVAKLERLLDENLVSTTARRELDALRYSIAMAQRY